MLENRLLLHAALLHSCDICSPYTSYQNLTFFLSSSSPPAIMCQISRTTMKCGHNLDFIKAKCQIPKTRDQCHTITETRSIRDSCAECHLPHRRKHNRDRYEFIQGHLMTYYLDAKKRGDKERMLQLEDMMQSRARQCILENQGGSTPMGAAEPVWPGKREEDDEC